VARSRAYKISFRIAVLSTALAVAVLALALIFEFDVTFAAVLAVAAAAAVVSHRLLCCQEAAERRATTQHEELRAANASLKSTLELHSRSADNAFRLIAMDTASSRVDKRCAADDDTTASAPDRRTHLLGISSSGVLRRVK
jgi:hypothetical protein